MNFPLLDILKTKSRERDGAQALLECMAAEGLHIGRWPTEADKANGWRVEAGDMLVPVTLEIPRLIAGALGIDYEAYCRERDALMAELTK